jgi:hypothetical protein
VELRGIEPLTYSKQTRLSGRLWRQAVLTVRKAAGHSVETVGPGKLSQILLRTHCEPANELADSPAHIVEIHHLASPPTNRSPSRTATGSPRR